VLLLPFLVHGAGGGDVKMLFAAGAITGWSGLFAMLWIMALTGITLGVILLLMGRVDGSRLRHYAQCIFNWRYDRKAGAAAIAPKTSEKVRMPFSIPIATGLLVSLFATAISAGGL
jgi:prepilin signal peptidase PulO-like enzyme (type II secretory pathway)